MTGFRRPAPALLAVLAVLAPLAVAAPPGTTADAGTRPTRTTTTRPRPATTRPAPTTTRPAPTTAPRPVTGSVTVFAAASLTASFTDIAAAFERAHPQARVTLAFGGSSTLVTQIRNGAPADVFASADVANMDRLAADGRVAGPATVFTRNRLMIVVPRGNPLRVQGLADLARPEVFVALGAPGVPAGDYAREILARAGVEVRPRSLEPNVSAIVNKAALKEIDAGIVYVTDVALDEYRVDGIAIPPEQNVVASYPVAVIEGARNPAAARAFVAFTLSPTAQAILTRYQFLPPS